MTNSKRKAASSTDKRPTLTIEGEAKEVSPAGSTADPAKADPSSEPYREIGAEAAGLKDNATESKPGTAAAEPSNAAAVQATDAAAASEPPKDKTEREIASAVDIRPGDDTDPIFVDDAKTDPAAAETLDVRPGEEPSLASEETPAESEPSVPIYARPDPNLDGVGHVPSIDEDPADSLPPPPPPRRRGGFFSHMAAGLLGGVVGVLATGLAWPWIEDQLQLEPESAQLTQIEARLAQIESDSAEPGQTGSTPQTVDLGAVDTRIDEKLAPLREQVAGLGQPAPAGANDQIAQLTARVDALAKQAPDGSSEVEPKVDALDNKAAALDKRVAALEAKIPDVAAKVNANAAESRNAALAIAVANLRGAVASGNPYQNELNALKSLAKDDLDLEGLEARAGNGVPTQAELTQRFPASASAAKKAEARSVAENRSWGGRLVENAKSLVKVRRSGEDATGSEATVTALDRAADWLKGGDLNQAVHEVGQLQGPAAQPMSGWLGSARARIVADDALGKLQRASAPSASASGPRR